MSHTVHDPKLILAASSEADRRRVEARMRLNRVNSETILAATSHGAIVLVLLNDGTTLQGSVAIPCRTVRDSPYDAPRLALALALRLADGQVKVIKALEINQAEVL
jgi:hypothetical protein